MQLCWIQAYLVIGILSAVANELYIFFLAFVLFFLLGVENHTLGRVSCFSNFNPIVPHPIVHVVMKEQKLGMR